MTRRQARPRILSNTVIVVFFFSLSRKLVTPCEAPCILALNLAKNDCLAMKLFFVTDALILITEINCCTEEKLNATSKPKPGKVRYPFPGYLLLYYSNLPEDGSSSSSSLIE